MNKINSEILVKGVMTYIDKNVIANIQDTFLKITLKTIILTAAKNELAYVNMVENHIRTGLLSDILSTDADGYFDAEDLIDAVRQAVNECGELQIKFPPVRFVSPEEKVLTFTATDISTLKQYLTNAANGGK